MKLLSVAGPIKVTQYVDRKQVLGISPDKRGPERMHTGNLENLLEKETAWGLEEKSRGSAGMERWLPETCRVRGGILKKRWWR